MTATPTPLDQIAAFVPLFRRSEVDIDIDIELIWYWLEWTGFTSQNENTFIITDEEPFGIICKEKDATKFQQLAMAYEAWVRRQR